MSDRTPEELAQVYSAALDSVDLIKGGQQGEAAEWLERVEANRVHLETIRAYEGWTTEDFTEIDAIIGQTAEELVAAYPPGSDMPVPREVAALQALMALSAAGMADAYETFASDPARTFEEKAFIQRADKWRRNSPVVAGAGAALGLTEEQIDDLFKAAYQIAV